MTIPVRSNTVWSPATAPGLVLDFDTGAGVTLVTGKVSQWVDQSANALVASQSTDANRPTFSAAPLSIIGSDASRLDIAGMSAPTSATIFVVCSTPSPEPGNGAYLISGAAGGFGIIESFVGPGVFEWLNGADRYAFNVSGSGKHLLAVTQVNGGALNLYYDGALVSGSPHTAGVTLKSFQSFFNIIGGTTGGYTGSIMQTLVFNRILGADELSRATAALKARWGTP